MFSKIFPPRDRPPRTPAWLTQLEPFPDRQKEESPPRGTESQISKLNKTVQCFTHSSNREQLKGYLPFSGAKFKHVKSSGDSSADNYWWKETKEDFILQEDDFKDFWLRETSIKFHDLAHNDNRKHKGLFAEYEDIFGALVFAEGVLAMPSEDGETWVAEIVNVGYYLVLKDKDEPVWKNDYGVTSTTIKDFDDQMLPIQKA
jgi:hypothetical protein